MALWRRLVLFGDSLTQYSFQEGGWGAIISDALQRKGDVLNRGFSGYTSEDAVNMMEKVLPTGSLEAEDVATIFFGANDSVLPGFGQHVSLESYSSSLHTVVKHMIGLGLPQNRIICISPPPVDEQAWETWLISEGKGTVTDRRNEVTKQYAEACRKVASGNGCRFVNLWEIFMQQADYRSYLDDGLHFSALGNKLTAQLLMPHITDLTKDWKENYPDWKDIHP